MSETTLSTLDHVTVKEKVIPSTTVGNNITILLADSIVARDDTTPQDIVKVVEYGIIELRYYRGWELTDWENERNKRIIQYMTTHKEFPIFDFQRYVWKEQITLQEMKDAYHYRSPFIKAFTAYLLSELERKGYIRTERRFIDHKLIPTCVVLNVPTLETINTITTTRLYDIVFAPMGYLLR